MKSNLIIDIFDIFGVCFSFNIFHFSNSRVEQKVINIFSFYDCLIFSFILSLLNKKYNIYV